MGKGLPQPNERVRFSPPIGLKRAKAQEGKIVDWTPFRVDFGIWRYYAFQAQRIVWNHGRKSIRIVYYRRNTRHDRWRFASQTTVNSSAQVIKAICRDILKKRSWRG